MTKLFQIYEPDLQRLEHCMPRLYARLGIAKNDPEVQVMVEEVKEILSNVRWDYGPHTNVEIIPAGPPQD